MRGYMSNVPNPRLVKEDELKKKLVETIKASAILLVDTGNALIEIAKKMENLL
jgi:hypothetical protein